MDLLERVAALQGPSDLIDAEIYATLGGAPHTTTAGDRTIPLIQKGDPEMWPAYTASLDASVALVERVLPLHWWKVSSGNEDDTYAASIGDGSGRYHAGPTPAIALLRALLSTLPHSGQGDGDG